MFLFIKLLFNFGFNHFRVKAIKIAIDENTGRARYPCGSGFFSIRF